MSKDAYTQVALPGRPGGALLFTFHGTGGNESQLVGFGREIVPDAAIVSPRGDVAELGGAGRFFRRLGEGVYDMADLERATAKMAGYVAAHADAEARRPVIGLGYSNGANILASVVFARPDLFDAAVLMHPLIPFEPRIAGPLTGRRILITAGRRDPICPPAETEKLEARLRAAGAGVEVVWHQGGHEVRNEEVEAARRFLAAVTAKEKTGG